VNYGVQTIHEHVPAVPPVEGPRVVGVDTSLTGTGLASSEGWCRVIGYVDKSKKNPISKLPRLERLAHMNVLLDAVMAGIGVPDLAVLEGAALSKASGGAHERGWLWWRVFERLLDAGIPTGVMSTNQRIHYATGKGRGVKGVVLEQVVRRWPQWQTCGNDNAADAVVLMAAGRDWLRHRIGEVPTVHRKAVENADWPEAIDVSVLGPEVAG
jgi:crossover junction endodeoxyribonuclease RuvC